MELLIQDSVTLVTKDKGFYKSRDFKQGLADNLAQEVKEAANKFTIMDSIKELLDIVRDEQIHIDCEALTSAVLAASDVASFVSNKGFAIGDVSTIENRLFATECPGILLVQYEIERNCLDVSGLERLRSKIVLTGTGSYNYSTQKVEQVVPGNAALSFVDVDEAVREFRIAYASGNMHIGHRTVEYQERSFSLTS